METLSPNTTLMSGPDVWIEGEALEQLSRIASLPGCSQAVGLPDIHPGPGIPIGAAFAFDGVVRPGLVGADAGCGVRLTALPKLKARGDQLERRIRSPQSRATCSKSCQHWRIATPTECCTAT